MGGRGSEVGCRDLVVGEGYVDVTTRALTDEGVVGDRTFPGLREWFSEPEEGQGSEGDGRPKPPGDS